MCQSSEVIKPLSAMSTRSGLLDISSGRRTGLETRAVQGFLDHLAIRIPPETKLVQAAEALGLTCAAWAELAKLRFDSI